MSSESQPTYYELLEVSPTAGDQEIWGAYSRMRTYYVEDPQFRLEFSNAEAQAIIGMLDEAYDTLRDPAKRRGYDQKLASLFARNQRLPDFIEDSERPSTPRASKALTQNAEDELQFYYPLPEEGADGAYIKQLREDAGLSRDEICAITRIPPHHIDAIESDKIDSLPAPVFVRGFIVQIAKTFGLNEKLVSDSYMERFKRHRSE